MIRIGLTGTIGAGKSTVAGMFERWGAYQIDADGLAREAVAPGTTALDEIVSTWGRRTLSEDGSLDRDALRRIVTEDPSARERLERIVHPRVRELRAARREAARESGAVAVVEEIPLLFETGLEEDYDVLLAVDAPFELRRGRTLASRAIDAEQFAALDAAQLDGAAKRARAHEVIVNDGELDSLEEAARAVWERHVGATGGAGRVSVDLHMHTRHSYDCMNDPRDVVRRARAVGLDRIAVTDHNEIDGAFEARDLDPELVIVGEEVRTGEGLDLIGLYLEEKIPKGGTFRAVADAIHQQGGIVYLPHPFDRYRGTDEDFLEGVAACVDLVEAFNARVHDASRNARALQWAGSRDLPVGAGSDAHLIVEIGRGRAVVPAFEGRDDLLKAFESSRIEGRTSGHWVHAGSTWAKLWKGRHKG